MRIIEQSAKDGCEVCEQILPKFDEEHHLHRFINDIYLTEETMVHLTKIGLYSDVMRERLTVDNMTYGGIDVRWKYE